jgi:hypothetical protein
VGGQLLSERAKPQLSEDEEPEFRQDVIAMPRDGSLILSDVRGPTLSIVCEPCGRRGRYNVERLMAEHGDAKPKIQRPARAKIKARLTPIPEVGRARAFSLSRRFYPSGRPTLRINS